MEDMLGRLLPRIGGIETVERLAALSGSDFTSVMLEVIRRRAERETPASVLRRYERDRARDTPGRLTAVRLAAVQRVIRAPQLPDAPGFFAHFGLFGMVTAGRDTGSLGFERSALAGQLEIAIRGVTAAIGPGVQIAL